MWRQEGGGGGGFRLLHVGQILSNTFPWPCLIFSAADFTKILHRKAKHSRAKTQGEEWKVELTLAIAITLSCCLPKEVFLCCGQLKAQEKCSQDFCNLRPRGTTSFSFEYRPRTQGYRLEGISGGLPKEVLYTLLTLSGASS